MEQHNWQMGLGHYRGLVRGLVHSLVQREKKTHCRVARSPLDMKGLLWFDCVGWRQSLLLSRLQVIHCLHVFLSNLAIHLIQVVLQKTHSKCCNTHKILDSFFQSTNLKLSPIYWKKSWRRVAYKNGQTVLLNVKQFITQCLFLSIFVWKSDEFFEIRSLSLNSSVRPGTVACLHLVGLTYVFYE